MKKAKLIKVEIRPLDDGLFRATSPDVRALHVVDETYEAVKVSAQHMLRDYYDVLGEQVAVFEVDGTGPSEDPAWVVVEREAVTA